MIIIIKKTKKDLLKIFSPINNAVSKKNVNLLLTHFLIKLNGNKITIIGGDGNVELQHTDSQEIENQEQTFTVEAQKLLDIIKVLHDGDVEICKNKDELTIKSGLSTFKLNTIEGSNYPLMPKQDQLKNNCNLSETKLKELLKLTCFAVAQQESTRPFLTALFLNFKQNELNVVGTDASRLAYVKTEIEFDDNQNFLLPRETVMELIDLLNDTDTNVNINWSENQVRFVFGEFEFVSKLLECSYSDYEKILLNPNDEYKTVTCNRQALIDAVQRTVVVLLNEKTKVINLNFNQEKLTFSCQNSKNENAHDEINTVNELDETIDISLKVESLLDVLNHIKSEDIVFTIKNQKNSILIGFPNSYDYQYIAAVFKR